VRELGVEPRDVERSKKIRCRQEKRVQKESSDFAVERVETRSIWEEKEEGQIGRQEEEEKRSEE
jgi:hypothetical protein